MKNLDEIKIQDRALKREKSNAICSCNYTK